MTSPAPLRAIFFSINTPIVFKGIEGADSALHCFIERHVQSIDPATQLPGARLPELLATDDRPVSVTLRVPGGHTGADTTCRWRESYWDIFTQWQSAARDTVGSLSEATVMGAMVRDGKYTPDDIVTGILYQIRPAMDTPCIQPTAFDSGETIVFPFVGRITTNATTLSIAKRLVEYHGFSDKRHALKSICHDRCRSSWRESTRRNDGARC